MYDHDLDITQAISRLSEREQYDRAFRIRTAIQQSIQHKGLPKDQWVTPEQVRYNSPFQMLDIHLD